MFGKISGEDWRTNVEEDGMDVDLDCAMSHGGNVCCYQNIISENIRQYMI